MGLPHFRLEIAETLNWGPIVDGFAEGGYKVEFVGLSEGLEDTIVINFACIMKQTENTYIFSTVVYLTTVGACPCLRSRLRWLELEIARQP